MRRTLWAALCGVALLASGCGLLPSLPALPSPSAGVTAGQTSPPSGSAPSASSRATPTPTQTLGVVLSGDGVAGHDFGTKVGDVEPALRVRLGKPNQVMEDIGCPLNPLWTRTLRWQGLIVNFEATGAKKTKQTTLSTWTLRLSDGVPKGVTLAGGLPLHPTFAQLKASYPGAQLTEELGWFLMEPVDGIVYLGDNKTKPSEILSAPIHWCE
ncbi:MAG: hypothetical protein WBB78_05860 [Propionicimonas sp.]